MNEFGEVAPHDDINREIKNQLKKQEGSVFVLFFPI